MMAWAIELPITCFRKMNKNSINSMTNREKKLGEEKWIHFVDYVKRKVRSEYCADFISYCLES